MTKLIDFFPYFHETGKELLELRVHMLKDYVDEFVICESNKTQSGSPIIYTLEETINELQLPKNKIKVLKLEIPEDDKLDIQLIDKYNCSENYDFENLKNGHNLNSLRARVRERMQKDSLLQVLDNYEDDDIFLHSDADEIIDPKNINWILNIVKNTKNAIIKIPLVNLEGRADLRVFFRSTNLPKPWNGGMFFATKTQLNQATPTQIRSNVFNPLPIVNIVDNGKIVEDLGWHFSWMGDASIRLKKCKAFTHYDDKFTNLIGDKYSSDAFQKFLIDLNPDEEETSPSGLKDTILKKYPHENLPKEIFNLFRVKKYLLPIESDNKLKQEINKIYDSHPHQDNGIIETNQFIINPQSDNRLFVVDNFYEDPIAVREFALSQTYFPGEGAVGHRTRKQFLFTGIKEKFEKIMNISIPDHTESGFGWKDIGINGRFQYCEAGTSLVYHCDAQRWAAMIFLCPDAPPSAGTSFFRHKETKIYHNNQIKSDIDLHKVFNQHTFLDPSPYEKIDNVANIFNRLVIFDGGLIHSASEYFGWNIYTSRLFHIFFFDQF
jgi:hypothetical protein